MLKNINIIFVVCLLPKKKRLSEALPHIPNHSLQRSTSLRAYGFQNKENKVKRIFPPSIYHIMKHLKKTKIKDSIYSIRGNYTDFRISNYCS